MRIDLRINVYPPSKGGIALPPTRGIEGVAFFGSSSRKDLLQLDKAITLSLLS